MGSTKVHSLSRLVSHCVALLTARTVSDVFHHGGPETAMWEFKHGNGNFKRGDLVGLREIKRRASRHALVHREYSSTRAPPSHVQTHSHSQPGTPAETMPTIQQPQETGGDPRTIESTLYDLSARLQRSEENAHFMHIRQQAMVDTMTRILHFNQEITRSMLNLAPGDHPIHRDGTYNEGTFFVVSFPD